MFVRLRDDLMVCPLGGYDGEGNIEFRADGLDRNGRVSNLQFCPQSGLTWARLNCDFGEGDDEMMMRH